MLEHTEPGLQAPVRLVAVRRRRGHARGQPQGHASMAPFHKGPAPGLRPTDGVSKAETTSRLLDDTFGRKPANGYFATAVLTSAFCGQKTPSVALGYANK